MSADVSRAETPASNRPARPAGDLRAYVQLLRLPAVFTALADIFLGYSLTHAALDSVPPVLLLLLATSACLYLAGMVFNDLFDRRIDAVERPQRPLPSGRISSRAAVTLGGVLIVAGLSAAAALRRIDPVLCGWNPLSVAGLLVAAIFLYNGVLKSTPLGPVSMGLCRFLNVLLGASASGFLFGRPFDNPQRWIATGLAVYVAGVTWFARHEATESRRRSLWGALVVINAGIAVLMGWVRFGRPGPLPLLPLVLLGAIALTINRRMLATIAAPSPPAVQSTVRTLLLTIISLDAAMIFAKTDDIRLASAIAAGLIVPALVLGRAARIT